MALDRSGEVGEALDYRVLFLALGLPGTPSPLVGKRPPHLPQKRYLFTQAEAHAVRPPPLPELIWEGFFRQRLSQLRRAPFTENLLGDRLGLRPPHHKS